LNVPQELSREETSNDTSSPTTGNFGLMEPLVEPVQLQTVDVQQEDRPDQFVTADELSENRLSQDGTKEYVPPFSFSVCVRVLF